MNLSFSPSNSSETLTLVPGVKSDSGRENPGSTGGDGFTELLDNLASIVPVSALVSEGESTPAKILHIADLPTGKTLPVDGESLPHGETTAAKGGAGTDAGGKVIPILPTANPAAPLDLEAAVATKPAAFVQADVAGKAIPADPVPNEVKSQAKTAASSIAPTLNQVPSETAIPAPAKGEGLKLQISQATDPSKLPSDLKATTGLSSVESVKARIDNNVPAADLAMRSNTTPSSKAPLLSIEPGKASAMPVKGDAVANAQPKVTRVTASLSQPVSEGQAALKSVPSNPDLSAKQPASEIKPQPNVATTSSAKEHPGLTSKRQDASQHLSSATERPGLESKRQDASQHISSATERPGLESKRQDASQLTSSATERPGLESKRQDATQLNSSSSERPGLDTKSQDAPLRTSFTAERPGLESKRQDASPQPTLTSERPGLEQKRQDAATSKVERPTRIANDGLKAAAPATLERKSELSGSKPAAEQTLVERSAAAEKLAVTAPRSPTVVEAPKVAPQILAGVTENQASFARPIATTPVTTVNDPFLNVERVVDQLMTARQVDLTKPASIAVAHRDFGALTVTFDQSTSGSMNVEIAAESNEAQRALAAAMANDRGSSRQQDTGTQTTAAQNQMTQGASDRAASSNAGGSGLNQGSSDDQRSQHSEQRSRHNDRTANHNHAQAQKPNDDALYA